MNEHVTWRRGIADFDRYEEQFQPFIGTVVSVDYEALRFTLKDTKTGIIYDNVRIIPANSSSPETTDAHMPEEGSVALAMNLSSRGGYVEVVVVNWLTSDTLTGVQAVASRPFYGVPGYEQRLRGTYRKAYPGQKSVSNTNGYTEKLDTGWDRSSADFSRDRIDTLSRTWTQVTGRRLSYDDGGLKVSGPVNRPKAANIVPRILPDGTSEYVLYLQPGAKLTDRYVSGQPDVIPLTENRELVQEFALDFPVPAEALGTSLMDTVLGTNASAWNRTTVVATGNVSHDSQSYSIDQTWDHPYKDAPTVGPTTNEGITPQRRGYVVERTSGTLVGYNLFDPATYGQPLKPVLFPYTALGKFSTDVSSSHLPVVASTDHIETRVAATTSVTRFPNDYNTTRWEVTKEGMLSFEISSTMPKENIPLLPLGSYEHPHGAGRSVEGHLIGSMKLVVGKNRDEEEALDIQALGQAVIRLGADDTQLPNNRRSVNTQLRASSDAVLPRTLQYWTKPQLVAGDAVSLTSKVGAENISLRGAFDGGTVMRFGARNAKSLRRHMMNGYQDGPGKNAWAANDPSRQDSRSNNRPTYGAGDSVYAFHDLTQAGSPQVGMLPYNWSGSPITQGGASMDAHGLSIDFHTVQDILLRVGANTASGQSMLLDLAGGLVAWLGKDNQGRSVTSTLDGGVELVIGPNTQGKGLRLEITGDMDWTVKGNFHMNVTGDTVWSSNAHVHNVTADYVTTAQAQTHMALTRSVIESPEIIHNQGAYSSSTDDVGSPATVSI
jgi:hypothetical protein